MLTLAIETSNPGSAIAPDSSQSVAIGRLAAAGASARSVTLLASEPVAVASRHDDDLQPAIARACAAAGIEPRSLEAIAVSIGPGGFTALRVAVAAARMIALASRVPGGARCIGVPTALAAAIGYRLQCGPNNPVLFPLGVALAGKHDAAYITVFQPQDLGPPLSGWKAPPLGRICSATDLASLGVQTLLADAHLPQSLREAAEGLTFSVLAPRLDATSVLHAAALVQPVDRTQLLPLYGREPEAVTLWRQRRGG